MTRVRLSALLSLLAFPALAQRLPRTVIPEHYTVQFAPDLASGTFEGEETIQVTVREPVSTIELNALELQLSDVTVTAGESTQSASVTLDAGSQTARFTLPSQLAVGPAELHLHFAGILNEQLHGFYQAHTTRRKYAVTEFEPVDARCAFPCFDEPDLKATFTISVIADVGDTAVSNGSILSDRPGRWRVSTRSSSRPPRRCPATLPLLRSATFSACRTA